MDARLLNPLLGVAIATSISLAFTSSSAEAQYYPSAQMVVPQPMAVIPQPMPMRNMAVVPASPQGFTPKAYGSPGVQPAGWPAPSLPPSGSQPAAAPPTQVPAARGQAVAQSENFIVFARDQAWANEVSETAERLRKELAMHWLGRELPPWSARCPLHVHDGANLGASGETRFVVSSGMAGDWMMSVQGTRERILDSVLPHEISHTIFASHFGKLNKYVPRWADEGAATTVENEAEKKKHRHYLKRFLQTGRGLAFNKMFQLKEYPDDILPLYAQGHSAVQFLIDQAGPQHFVRFLEMGMRTEQWQQALAKHYDYATIWDFQRDWNKWLLDGSPSDLTAYAPRLQKQGGATVVAASANTNAVPMAGLNGRRPQPNTNGTLPSDPKSLELTPSHVQPDSFVAQANNSVVRPASGESVLAVPFEPIANNVASSNSNSVSSSTTQVATSGNESWFKTRLRQTSGQSATPIPPHNNFVSQSSFAANAVRPGASTTGEPSKSQASRDDMVSLSGTTGLRASQPMAGSAGVAAQGFQASGLQAAGVQASGASSAGFSTARQGGTQSIQVLELGPNERLSGGSYESTIR